MATSKSRILLFVAIPALILMLPLSIYLLDSVGASDRVARNITVSGVDVARQTEEEAVASVEAYAAALTARITQVEVNGQLFDVDPSALGLTFDVSSAVAEALTLHKDGAADWLKAFRNGIDVPLAASLDADVVRSHLVLWEREAIPNPAFEGSVSIVNRNVEFEYPRSGRAIDRDAAPALLLAALQAESGAVVPLPIVQSDPKLTESEISAAVQRANRIIDRGVVLRNDEYEFELRVDPFDLAGALQAEVVNGDDPTIRFSLDHSVITRIIESVRESFEVPPVDAAWKIVLVDDFEDYPDQFRIKDSPQKDVEGLPENDTIELIPSRNGTTVDAAEVAAAVEAAALGDGEGTLPLGSDALPAFTTEMAEAFGDLYELAEFTTWTPGRNRVHNIQLMADLVDDSIVMPGETFSVNEVVGRRTPQKGFKSDCIIANGELSCTEDPINIGGGVSQFATTIFNTIFFSCLEVVTHTPHSIYYSRYPEGREATLGFPHPDIVFKNDTEAPVIVRTSYTPRTITVTFFGNNGGTTCGAERGYRTRSTDAAVTYRADEEGVVLPGEEFIASEGSGGWTIGTTRIFYDIAGVEFDRESFSWRYRGERQIILMHPCEEKVGGDGVCPLVLPSVAGLPAIDARAALESLGFIVTEAPKETSIEADNGLVESSSPGPGILADPDDVNVTIFVWDWDGTTPDE
ncbi:MAG: VanW family protein [Actinomycetota bacterium]|nr:VanW family protein [Actinomycetota bacterium]